MIRADADRQLGTGHVMRQLALASHIRRRGSDVILVSDRLAEAIGRRFTDCGVRVIQSMGQRGDGDDARGLVVQASASTADWVVIDGYHFGHAYVKAVTEAHRVLWVDDFGGVVPVGVHLILNQNVYAVAESYTGCAEETQVLIGPSYALLRQEFLHVDSQPMAIHAKKILVTMGGADPVNATNTVVGLLQAMSQVLDVCVVLGPCGPTSVDEVIGETGSSFRVVRAPEDMVGLMQWADLAIASASSTVYELCRVGVPTLLVELVPHQRDVAMGMEQIGACERLGSFDKLEEGRFARSVANLLGDATRRRQMQQAGRALVDGNGVNRVTDALTNGLGALRGED